MIPGYRAGGRPESHLISAESTAEIAVQVHLHVIFRAICRWRCLCIAGLSGLGRGRGGGVRRGTRLLLVGVLLVASLP